MRVSWRSSAACGWAVVLNAIGLPAVALPVGIADGLPQSVQVIGPRYREDLCLDAAAVLAGGHGEPMTGPETAASLCAFARLAVDG